MMKFEKSWSIGNAVTLIVIVASIFTQYGISSQEVVVIKKPEQERFWFGWYKRATGVLKWQKNKNFQVKL